MQRDNDLKPASKGTQDLRRANTLDSLVTNSVP